MSALKDIRPSVERFVTAVSNSMRLEVAVFDSDSQLFYSTPTYVKKKGRTVHARGHGKRERAGQQAR